VAETADSVAAPREEDEAGESVTELIEQLGRDVSRLVFYEARLAAARNKPELRRAARDGAAGLLAALAFGTAFALANVAAVQALSKVMSGWAAALVLALAWTALGLLLTLALWARAKRASGRDRKTVQEARDEAEQAVRTTLERLSPVITKEIALVAVPMASGIADGVVDAGDDLIEGADEFVETFTEELPGGGVVNQMWDVVLMPGRFGVRIATTVLKRGDET
jgi:Putative Actinobacterial Holin-X, holin superfamily III